MGYGLPSKGGLVLMARGPADMVRDLADMVRELVDMGRGLAARMVRGVRRMK